MRYMLIVKPNIDHERYEQGVDPDAAAAMGRFNEELTQAGVLLAMDGLHPESEGARLEFHGGRASITDGPFTESKEMIGGYWIIQARSKEEAVEWASRAPMSDGEVIEVRRIYEMEDHSQAVRDAHGELSAPPPAQTASTL